MALRRAFPIYHFFNDILDTIRHSFSCAMLMGAIIIPTQSVGKWETLKYSRIPSNEITFRDQGIFVRVKHSASALIYPFDSIKKISGFKTKGEFHGLPYFRDINKQGDKGEDDYALGIGFIVPGTKRLTGLKRFFSPEWAKNIYAKVPKELGLDHVHFFNITQNPSQVGQHRAHPSSDLIEEEFIAQVIHAGKFNYQYSLKEPLDAIALWINIDGDDTKSDYDVSIFSIEISQQASN